MVLKKINFFVISFLSYLFFIPLESEEISLPDPEAYLEVASNKTQVPNPNQKSFIITDNTSFIKNFKAGDKGITFTAIIDGIYLIGSGVQVGILNPKVSGYIDVWFELNGAPIPATNSRQYISQSAEVALMTNAFLIELKNGDVFSIGFSASGPEIGIVAFTNLPNNEPDIVSIGISLFKIY
ncbi:MAG: hypothetical protein FJZ59_03390 [Chlamydiae bacterium]|nr:hypothetical protein [Chlamydiota bacterium]